MIMNSVFLIQLQAMNTIACWKKFGINLTYYRNLYGGIMFHIKFPVIFSEDLDIFKCFLMKQNFEQFHSQNIALQISIFSTYLCSQLARHGILGLPFAHCFRHG